MRLNRLPVVMFLHVDRNAEVHGTPVSQQLSQNSKQQGTKPKC